MDVLKNTPQDVIVWDVEGFEAWKVIAAAYEGLPHGLDADLRALQK